MDWIWIEKELRKINLWNFAVMAFSFCKEWWKVDLPIKTVNLDEPFFLESTKFIFENGVFGNDNENAEIHVIEKEMRHTALPRSIQSIGVGLKNVFIPYNEVIRLPYCSFVKGRRLLLPAAWIYRIYYVARYKKGNYNRGINLLFRSGKVVDYHRRLMDRWGI